ncbi:MAG: tetratricopeptide repeat protein [Bacteroidetes bacterium]|nr:tetratricopeptide repeat protein [Bacteroidota bacterium]MBT5529147.1 tetratricopeptide repeat protein [Cytophagia bacterium]MBT3801723.1 tetratricopeptide repeat protein [Bacteroidota bacterium]MBT3933644.1 tetratricopeptide repeat protein [Bacteroidota bacterium]MBT4728102.1 tetratricopeptide repeat protein [Bacteroidota bacterium]
MMKPALLLLLFCAISNLSFSQNYQHNIDSIWKVINTTEEDTVEILALLELTFNYPAERMDTSIYYAKLALKKAQKANFNFGISYAYFRLGRLYEYLTEYKKALVYYQKKLAFNKKTNDESGIYAAHGDIGYIYHYLGMYEKAIFHHHAALKVVEKNQDSSKISMCLNNIGTVYDAWKRPKKALEYYYKTIAIDHKLGENYGIAYTYNNIGRIYLDFKEYDSAAYYFNKSLKIKRETNNIRGVAGSLSNLGILYHAQKQYKKAIACWEEALAIYRNISDKSEEAAVLNNLGGAYGDMGDLDKSFTYITQAYDIAKDMDYLDLHINVYESLTKIYSRKGDYKNALKYHQLYNTVKDSVFNLEKNKQLEELETVYQTEKKEQQIKLQKTEIAQKDAEVKKQKAQRNIFIISFGLILLFAVYVIISIRRIAKEKAKSEKLLLNTLPIKVVNDLKMTGKTEPESFTDVTVYFSDVVGFTNMSTQLDPKQLIDELNDIFTAFDDIMIKNHCERIKTIGDAYLAVCGMPEKDENHAINMLNASIEIRDYLDKRNKGQSIEWKIRIGLHSGKVVGGVVGVRKYIYDVFGDTINTASRMESNSEPMRINISNVTHQLVKKHFENQNISFSKRSPIEVKGKGVMDMYFVNVD